MIVAVTVSVRFVGVVYSLSESSGRVDVCAEIDSPAVAEREFTLMVSSSDRDAGDFTIYIPTQPCNTNWTSNIF